MIRFRNVLSKKNMKEFLKRLVTLNKRDYIGLICWFLAGILLGSASLLLMVARELYQYYNYRLPYFEWEDIVRYGVVIMLGAVIHYEIIYAILGC